VTALPTMGPFRAPDFSVSSGLLTLALPAVRPSSFRAGLAVAGCTYGSISYRGPLAARSCVSTSSSVRASAIDSLIG
jgi:hypothetical protein